MTAGKEYFDEEKIVKSYDVTMLKRLVPFVRPYRILLLCSFVLIVLGTLLELSVPYVTKIAIDRYIVPKENADAENASDGKTRYLAVDISDPSIKSITDKYPDRFEILGTSARIPYGKMAGMDKNDLAALRNESLSGVWYAAIVLLCIIAAEFVLGFMREMTMKYAGQRVMHDLRMQLFSHITGLSVSFFNRNPVGRLVTRVTNDIQNMDEIFTSIIVFVLKDMFILIGITGILFYVNWKLTLVTFSVLPFVIYASFHFSGRARGVFREMRIKIAEINTKFSETIGGMRVIQLFGKEKLNYNGFMKMNNEYYLLSMRQIQIFAVFMPVVEIIGTTAVAVIIFYGGGGVLSRDISLGDLVAFISYMKMFFRPIRDIAEKYNIMQNALASAERIFLIMDSKEFLPVPDKSSCQDFGERIEKIEAENISFCYNRGETVLDRISFSVAAGETIALVGPTGSGKTSLAHLIMRFYDPTAGRILVNGTDLKETDIGNFRARTALVTQDPYIFSGSVRENIFHGNFSEKEMQRIFEASNCKQFIEKLPGNVDAELSEGGASISSGERQLLSIARAFARNPELIILDEATSYIDSETEAKVQKALANLMKNRTSIIIAHRLSTARNAERILVLAGGRIMESGPHHELMERRGFYFRLHQLGL